MHKNCKPWWQTVFDQNYLKIYVDIATPEITKTQVDFLTKVLDLPKGAVILDLACGWGRHSIGLAKLDFQVIGIDFSKHFLNQARQEAKKIGVKVMFRRQDMRHLNFVNKFNAVINMFNSFGYFEKESDHLLVLKKVVKSLKPKGKFLVDLNNGLETLMKLYSNRKVNRKTGFLTNIRRHKLSTGNIALAKNEFDPVNMRWFLTRTWKENGKLRKYMSNMRLFTLPELRHLMEESGLLIEKVWGDFDYSPYNINSPRMIILAKKR